MLCFVICALQWIHSNNRIYRSRQHDLLSMNAENWNSDVPILCYCFSILVEPLITCSYHGCEVWKKESIASWTGNVMITICHSFWFLEVKDAISPVRRGRRTIWISLSCGCVYRWEGLVQHSMRATVPLNIYMAMKTGLTWLTTALVLVASLGHSVADYQRTVSYEREVVVRWWVLRAYTWQIEAC